MRASSRRSSCFIAGDDDDDGISTISITSLHRTMSSLRSFNGRFYESRFDYRQPHFLHSCAFCKKSIGEQMDIFMYRGDTPFCSEECRQEQIDMDEASEKKLKKTRVTSMKTASLGSETQEYSIRTSSVAAA